MVILGRTLTCLWGITSCPIALSILLAILLPILLQVIQVGFALSNGHRDPYVRISDEVTVVVPWGFCVLGGLRGSQGCVSSNVVLGYGGGESGSFTTNWGSALGWGSKRDRLGNCKRALLNCAGRTPGSSLRPPTQVVHLAVVLGWCEVVGTEGVQQQGDEQVKHLERRYSREDHSVDELSPSRSTRLAAGWQDSHTWASSAHPRCFSSWGNGHSDSN